MSNLSKYPQAAREVLEKLKFLELDEKRKSEDSYLKSTCYRDMRMEMEYQFDKQVKKEKDVSL